MNPFNFEKNGLVVTSLEIGNDKSLNFK